MGQQEIQASWKFLLQLFLPFTFQGSFFNLLIGNLHHLREINNAVLSELNWKEISIKMVIITRPRIWKYVNQLKI